MKITGGLTASVSPSLDGSASSTAATATGYQLINLESSWWAQITGSQRGWDPPTGERPAIVSGLTLDGAEDELHAFGVYSTGVVRLSTQTADLTDEFEANGGLRLTVGSQSWVFLLAGADMGVPYFWSPSNTAEVIEVYNAISSATAATLEISDDPDVDYGPEISSLEITGGFSASISPTLNGSATATSADEPFEGAQWLVVESSDSDIWRINPDDPDDETGDFGLVGSFPSGLVQPTGIGYGDGKWLAIDNDGDELWRINIDDPDDETGDFGLVGALPSGLAGGQGIAYGDGKWLAIDNAGDELWRISPDDPDDETGDFGLVGTFPSGLISPTGIAYGNGIWLVLDNSGDELWRINPDDPDDETGDFGLVGALQTGFTFPQGIAYGDGKWLVVDSGNNNVWHINPSDPDDISGDFGLLGSFPADATNVRGIGYEPLATAVVDALEVTGGFTVSLSPALDGSATIQESISIDITGGFSVSLSPALDGSATIQEIGALEITGGFTVSISPDARWIGNYFSSIWRSR